MNDRFLGMLGLCARAGRLVSGTERVVEAIRTDGKAKLVIIASDVSQNTMKKIVDGCSYHNVDYVRVEYTKETISHAIGRSSYSSSVGILDQNFSDAIRKLI